MTALFLDAYVVELECFVWSETHWDEQQPIPQHAFFFWAGIFSGDHTVPSLSYLSP